MNKNFLLAIAIFFSFQCILSTSAYAVTTIVGVSEATGWNVLGFTANDVTYPNNVYFLLQFSNSGTADLNVSGNLTIKKDTSFVYVGKVFEDYLYSQQSKNFTFNWTPTDTGDFLANVTLNITSELNQTNLTSATTSFTVYSPPPPPPSGRPPSGGIRIPVILNITRTWERIDPNVSVRIEIENDFFAFTEITIWVEKESNYVKVEINRLLEKPGSVSEPPGEVYQYIEIKNENLEGDIRSVIIFRVENDWLTEKSIDKNSVTLNRYSGYGWEVLATELTGEDSDYAYYRTEFQGLSVFSVTGTERAFCIPKERRCHGDYLQECSLSGSWENLVECDYGCKEGGCTEAPALCTPGERRCSGNVLQICSGDGLEWENLEMCAYGCWYNQCQEMYVSYVTRMAVFVMFAILVVIVIIMIALVYMNVRTFLAGK